MFPYCCLLIIASIITMFSFQGAFESIKDSVKSQLPLELQSISHYPLSTVNYQLVGGGEYRDRTGDLLLARQALSQLS